MTIDIFDDVFTVSQKFRNDVKNFFSYRKDWTCLEVGSYKGYTTYFLGDVFKKVIGLENLDHHLQFSRKHNSRDNVEYIKFDIYADEWKFENIDVSYIDCDHSYEACKKDVENSLKLGVKYIIFDDYEVWCGVKKCVNEYCEKGILKKEIYIGVDKIPAGERLVEGNEGVICKVL